MCNWIDFKNRKPKPGERFIGAGLTKNGKSEWNLFTAPNHELKDDQGKIELTKEQQLDKIIEVYKLEKWMVPTIQSDSVPQDNCRRGIIPVIENCNYCPYSEFCKDPRKNIS